MNERVVDGWKIWWERAELVARSPSGRANIDAEGFYGDVYHGDPLAIPLPVLEAMLAMWKEARGGTSG